jgi:tetratricopeptide (TPR) repeat protein
MSINNIKDLMIEYAENPFDASINFKLALEYDSLGQPASAVSYYLRAAEYGYKTDQLIVYTSLLKMSLCFEKQGDRKHAVSNSILQAIAHLPKRPEAYFLLSRFYEKDGNWQECYTYATVGLMVLDNPLVRLPIGIDGYHGDYSLEFQVAMSAWWIGRKDESIKRLQELSLREDLSTVYRSAVFDNLTKVNC